jgi:ATP-dependent DNA helicase RecQ
VDPLFAALERHFGYDGFRPGQERLIRAILAGRDALGILPTGGGKSVIYLLPSAMRAGLTLVVSPLVSLMADQVGRAERAGIPAGALHQGVDARERSALMERARRGELRVLLVAPERLEVAAFRDALARLPLRLLAVDEAHCVVHWGFDFRPSYLRLAGLGARLGVPVVAVTATATPPVQRELEALLALRDPVRHVSSFDRANLRWAVLPVRDDAERWSRLERLVRASPGPALVYAGTRRQTEAVRAGLARRGVDAESYHAGLPPGERARVQDRFLGGSCPVVVATNAFGMGVDKPDVRRVVHWSAPGSLEAYYQEAGRTDERLHRSFLDSAHPPPRVLRRLARRLGSLDPARPEAERVAAVERAWGRGRPPDAAGLLRALERSGLVAAPPPDGVGEGVGDAVPSAGAAAHAWPRVARQRRRAARERLGAMRAYLRARGCRRAALLAYFGERAATARCGGCDRCAREALV